MIIYVNARFLTQPVTGVQRYGIECCRQIKKLCSLVVFLAPSNLFSVDVANELEVEIIGRNKGHLWEQWDLPNYLKKLGNPPILNLANTAPMFYSNNFVTIHDLAFYYYPQWNNKLFAKWYNFLIPRIAKKSRHIFTVSNCIKNELVSVYKLPEKRISVVFNGVPYNIAKQSGRIIKEKYILAVGTFNERKNHSLLIEAFLKSSIKGEYKLVIVGDKNKVFRTLKEGLALETKKESGNRNISSLILNDVIILENVADSELIDWYKKAQVVVSLSIYEGFGIPLIEGLFLKCNILCSDIPVYREIYGNFALFCDLNSIEDISEKLAQSVTEEKRYSDNELASFFEKYSYIHSAKIILEKLRVKTDS